MVKVQNLFLTKAAIVIYLMFGGTYLASMPQITRILKSDDIDESDLVVIVGNFITLTTGFLGLYNKYLETPLVYTPDGTPGRNKSDVQARLLEEAINQSKS
jgi:hypothetical protein